LFAWFPHDDVEGRKDARDRRGLVDERTHRVGKNEALFRQINEEIERLNRGVAAISDETFHIVCECGDLRCQERVVVPVQIYEDVRADSALFLITPGHEMLSTESVVEATQRYYVVKKHEGGAKRLAEVTDPRS
jgi:hypothetical protein